MTWTDVLRAIAGNGDMGGDFYGAFLFGARIGKNWPILTDYPLTEGYVLPDEPYPNQDLFAVSVSGGPMIDVPATYAVGIKDRALVSGIGDIITSNVFAPGAAFGVAIIHTATITSLNAAATDGLVLAAYGVQGGLHPTLAHNEPFSAGEVSLIAGWLDAYGLGRDAFAADFGMTAASMATWMRSHSRVAFCEQVFNKYPQE